MAWLLALVAGSGSGLLHAADFASPSFTAWQRAHQGRLTIEWPEAARVQQQRTPDHLILRFAEPLRSDVGSTLRHLSNFVDLARTTAAGRALSLALKSGVTPELKVQSERIVTVEFSRDPGSSPTPEIVVMAIDRGLRLALNWPGRTDIETTKDINDLRLRIVPAWEIDAARLAELERSLKPWFSGVRALSRQDSTTLQFTLEPHIAPLVTSDSTADGASRTIIDFVRDASAFPAPAAGPAGRIVTPKKRPETSFEAAASVNEGPPIPARRPVRATDLSANAETGRAAPAAAETPPSALTFDWAEPVGAAAFVRAGHLWIVFDQPDIDLLSAVPPPTADLEEGSVVPADGGVAVRYPLRRPTDFNVVRTATRWTVGPVGSAADRRPVPIERIESTMSLRVPSVSARRVVRIVDPAVGDRLDVLPVSDAGLGQSEGRRFVDVDILPTVQGLAWRPLSDRLIASLDDRGLTFEAPDGLSLSTITADNAALTEPVILDAMARKVEEPSHRPVLRPALKPSIAEPQQDRDDDEASSYFGLAGSEVDRHLVNEYRRIRRQAISKAAPEEQDQARLDLARLLVSERLAIEARTVLDMISDDGEPDITRRKGALSGIVAFLNGDTADASALLLDPDLSDDEEIDVWRGALAAIDGQWEDAARHWEAASDLLDNYPPRLRLDLGLLALETAIETEDDKMMQRSIRRLAALPLNPYDQARFDAAKALKAERAGNIDKARTLLGKVAESPSPAARTLADFQLAILDLGSTDLDAGKRDALDRLMPLWRGHPQERVMLDKLARRYREADALRDALTTWRRLIHLYPDAADSEELNRARQETFVQAVTGDDEPAIGRFDLYAIYLDFIDLLPDEPEVRKVHRHLARLLTQLDLLEEAIDVLQSLMASTADELERVQLATEIAALMLDLDKAGSALAVLDASERPGVAISPALDQQRRLTRAEALAATDRVDGALRELRDLSSPRARRLQIDILRRERRWPRLAAAIESHLNDRDDASPLAEDDQELVLWLALALQEGAAPGPLRDLRERYGEAMRDGPFAEAFDVVTQGADRAGDVEALLSATGTQLAELERFRQAASKP